MPTLLPGLPGLKPGAPATAQPGAKAPAGTGLFAAALAALTPASTPAQQPAPADAPDSAPSPVQTAIAPAALQAGGKPEEKSSSADPCQVAPSQLQLPVPVLPLALPLPIGPVPGGVTLAAASATATAALAAAAAINPGIYVASPKSAKAADTTPAPARSGVPSELAGSATVAAAPVPAAPTGPAVQELTAAFTAPAAAPVAVSARAPEAPLPGASSLPVTPALQVQPNPAGSSPGTRAAAGETKERSAMAPPEVLILPTVQVTTTVITAPAQAPAPAPVPFAAQLSKPVFTVAAAAPGEHVMTVKVTPENLGPVTVQAHISADGVKVQLYAPTDAGRAAVQDVLPDLRRDLAAAGLAASLDLSDRQAPQDGRGQGSGQQPARRTPTVTGLEPVRARTRPAVVLPTGSDTSLDILA